MPQDKINGRTEDESVGRKVGLDLGKWNLLKRECRVGHVTAPVHLQLAGIHILFMVECNFLVLYSVQCVYF